MNKVTEIMNAQQYFEEHQRALAALEHGAIDQIADELVKAYEGGKMMYLFGNGGSASLASHLACDLGKGTAYCNGGKRLRVLALTDNVATMTAWANDFSYEDMFSGATSEFCPTARHSVCHQWQWEFQNCTKCLASCTRSRSHDHRYLWLSGWGNEVTVRHLRDRPFRQHASNRRLASCHGPFDFPNRLHSDNPEVDVGRITGIDGFPDVPTGSRELGKSTVPRGRSFLQTSGDESEAWSQHEN